MAHIALAKATPGPWKIGSTTSEAGVVYNPNYISSADDDSICTVFEVPLHTTLAEIENSGTWDRGLANAHLISAAPEMLEALESLVAALTSRKGELIPIESAWAASAISECRMAAISAIKKAKGE